MSLPKYCIVTQILYTLKCIANILCHCLKTVSLFKYRFAARIECRCSNTESLLKYRVTAQIQSPCSNKVLFLKYGVVAKIQCRCSTTVKVSHKQCHCLKYNVFALIQCRFLTYSVIEFRFLYRDDCPHIHLSTVAACVMGGCYCSVSAWDPWPIPKEWACLWGAPPSSRSNISLQIIGPKYIVCQILIQPIWSVGTVGVGKCILYVSQSKLKKQCFKVSFFFRK